MPATYDDNNIFAKILRGEIPSTRVYETDDVVAFMDVMPQGTGHTLVVPKAPSRNLLETAFNADGVTVMQFNEPASGQTVYHLHFHVIPRFEGVALKPHTGQMEDAAVLSANAEKIRAAI